MMCFLHLYMKYTQPLFIQAIMGLKSLYDSKPVALYVLGKPAEGDLKRPFKQAGGLFGGMYACRPIFSEYWIQSLHVAAAGEPQTDKAAIDEAEKRVGPKKDE